MNIPPTLNLQNFVPVAESASSALVMVDQGGRIVLANSQAEKLFRYGRSEMLGRPVEILVPDRFRGRHSGFRNGFFAHSAARPMGMGRIYGLCRDGTEFPAEIGLKPIHAEDELFVLTAILDITEFTRNEASVHEANEVLKQRVTQRTLLLEAASKELEEFVHALALDLKAQRSDGERPAEVRNVP